MSGYVLWRTDQGGGWVAPPGRPSSYTRLLQDARIFETEAAAERNRCVGNEVIQPVARILERGRVR